MDRARLVVSVVFFLTSLLALFRAPALPFWFLAIGATEAGPAFSVLPALMALTAIPFARYRIPILWISGLSFLFFWSPLLRSRRLFADLPARLNAAFPIKQSPGPVVPLQLMPVQTVVFSKKDDVELRMDVYRTQTTQPQPVILLVHSGSWQSGERNELLAFTQWLAAQGWVVAAMDYRLAPRYHYPAQVEDVRDALAYLKKHASDWTMDVSRIVLLGRSAGGQIALKAAYTFQDPAVIGTIGFYGPYDMEVAYQIPGNKLIMDARKVLEDYMGGSPSQLAEGYSPASALKAAHAEAPPTLLVHGWRDELVWFGHSVRLDAKLSSLHVPHFFLALPWATHACEAVTWGPSSRLIRRSVAHFLQYVLENTRNRRNS